MTSDQFPDRQPLIGIHQIAGWAAIDHYNYRANQLEVEYPLATRPTHVQEALQLLDKAGAMEEAEITWFDAQTGD